MTIDIQRLRELLAAATPGPWSADLCMRTPWGELSNIIHVDSDAEVADRLASEDAALICAAVNALPQLLAIAEAATAWGQTMCTKPRECTHGDHAGDCDLGAAEIRLLAAVDAARKERT